MMWLKRLPWKISFKIGPLGINGARWLPFLPFVVALSTVEAGASLEICSLSDMGEETLSWCDALWNQPFRDHDRLATTLLLRDRLRREIGRWNRDNLDFATSDALLASLEREGDAASASCGPITYALKDVLEAYGIPVRLVSFYYLADDGKTMNGHSALEVQLESGNWVLIDGHAGLVWQDSTGNLGSATDASCQFFCYGIESDRWKYFPSFHGKQYENSAGLAQYAMQYMALVPSIHPHLIVSVARGAAISDRHVFVLDALEIFGERGSRVDQDLTQALRAKGLMHQGIRTTYINADDCHCPN